MNPKHLRIAAQKLAPNPDFRLVLRAWLGSCGALANSGMGANTFTSNALTTANAAGKLWAAEQLLSLFPDEGRELFIQILQEELQDARAERTSAAGREPAPADEPEAGGGGGYADS